MLRLIRAGEAHAFDRLVARYVRGALAVAQTFAPDGDEAEDIVQDAFIRVARGLDRFDARALFRPWFYTIVRNVGRTRATAQSRYVSIDERDGNGGALLDHITDDHDDRIELPDAIDRAEFRELVEAELARMTALQSSAFRLCEIDGFTAAEVADMLGIAPATVRVHTHRARGKLREMLTRHGYRRRA